MRDDLGTDGWTIFRGGRNYSLPFLDMSGFYQVGHWAPRRPIWRSRPHGVGPKGRPKKEDRQGEATDISKAVGMQTTGTGATGNMIESFTEFSEICGTGDGVGRQRGPGAGSQSEQGEGLGVKER